LLQGLVALALVIRNQRRPQIPIGDFFEIDNRRKPGIRAVQEITQLDVPMPTRSLPTGDHIRHTDGFEKLHIPGIERMFRRPATRWPIPVL
jgi:hypothetical protein